MHHFTSVADNPLCCAVDSPRQNPLSTDGVRLSKDKKTAPANAESSYALYTIIQH